MNIQFLVNKHTMYTQVFRGSMNHLVVLSVNTWASEAGIKADSVALRPDCAYTQADLELRWPRMNRTREHSLFRLQTVIERVINRPKGKQGKY